MAGLGHARAWGRVVFSSWGRDLAQLQSSEAQAGSPRILRPYWAKKASLFLSGASTLFALRCSLLPKETCEIFP